MNCAVFPQVLDDLRIEEGRRLEAYLDGEGVWTIGYGHTRGVRQGDTCTLAQADAWLMLDLQVAEADLDRKVPWWKSMPAPAQRALLNMCFNLGWPRLAGFHKMLTALEYGNFSAAADEAMNSKWSRQVGDGPGGKFDRAERIAGLFRGAATNVGA